MKPGGSGTCQQALSSPGSPSASASCGENWPRTSKFLKGFRPVWTGQREQQRGWSRGGRAAGPRLTRVVGDVGLGQVPAGDRGWLGLAEVFDELGLGDGGQHGARALLHAGVCEQLRRGPPVGVPHLVAQLRVEAGIAGGGERRKEEAGPVGEGRSQPASPRPGTRPGPQGGGHRDGAPGLSRLNGQHMPSTEPAVSPPPSDSSKGLTDGRGDGTECLDARTGLATGSCPGTGRPAAHSKVAPREGLAGACLRTLPPRRPGGRKQDQDLGGRREGC